jgi:hypothetical protein
MTERSKVPIAGAGPVGLTAALLLGHKEPSASTLPHGSAASAAGPSPGAALIRPEHVVLTPMTVSGEPGLNRFRGRVSHVAFLGEATECVVQVGGVEILVRGIAGQYDGSETVDVFFPPEKTLAIAVDEV